MYDYQAERREICELNERLFMQIAKRRYPWLTGQEAIFRMAADEFAPPKPVESKPVPVLDVIPVAEPTPAE